MNFTIITQDISDLKRKHYSTNCKTCQWKANEPHI